MTLKTSMHLYLRVCVSLGTLSYVLGGYAEDLSLYDLVEELNQNFYTFFGIEKEASISDIRKAYRKLSLEWHPDRNSAPDATDMFRKVVGVYETLKSSEMREKYDNVLEFGLPDWRQPIYYYRKMRKFSWYEAVLVMLVVASIAHYLMMWAAYYEQYLVIMGRKKPNKKTKIDPANNMWDELEDHKPQLLQLLPCLIVRESYYLTKHCITYTVERCCAKEEPEIVEDVPIAPRRTVAPQPVFEYAVATDLKAVANLNPEFAEKYNKEVAESQRKESSSTWTFDELSLLIRLSTDKFPPGTPNRWEQMAGVLNRKPDDVTNMAGKLKHMKQDEYRKLARGQQSNVVNTSSASTVISKADSTTTEEWSQEQQKTFELALQQYPKGVEDRWDRISEAVGGKTKEQCIARFKHLAELIRRRKAGT